MCYHAKSLEKLSDLSYCIPRLEDELETTVKFIY